MWKYSSKLTQFCLYSTHCLAAPSSGQLLIICQALPKDKWRKFQEKQGTWEKFEKNGGNFEEKRGKSEKNWRNWVPREPNTEFWTVYFVLFEYIKTCYFCDLSSRFSFSVLLLCFYHPASEMFIADGKCFVKICFQILIFFGNM